MGKVRVVRRVYEIKYSWKGHKDRNRHTNRRTRKGWASSVGLRQRHKLQHPHHVKTSPRGHQPREQTALNWHHAYHTNTVNSLHLSILQNTLSLSQFHSQITTSSGLNTVWLNITEFGLTCTYLSSTSSACAITSSIFSKNLDVSVFNSEATRKEKPWLKKRTV